VLTYTEASRLVRAARSGRKKLEGNTYLEKVGEDYVVSFHGTDIVRIYPDGTYTLHTGGHRTATTKKRLGDHSPCHIFQRKGEWWFQCQGHELSYLDGLRVDYHGIPTDPIFRDMLTDGRPAGELAARLEELSQGR
jgi:hypothetical protein